MGLLGQVGAGVGFLGVGLWQAFVSAKAYRLGCKVDPSMGRSPRSCPGSSIRRTEHAAVAILAALHMAFALVSSQSSQNNGAGVGAAFALERFGVAAVFFLYAAVAIVSESTAALPLPAGMVDWLAMVAFGEEFSLFYLTSRGTPPGLETQYYSLLLVPIGVCMVATAVEMAYPAAVLAPLVRSLALILQGTWFFQMAGSLFSRKWMAKGCQLLQTANGVQTVRCDAGMSLMRGRALATLQFNCHLALLLLVLLPSYGLLSKVFSSPSNYERLDQSQAMEGVIELDEERSDGLELAQSSYVHVFGGEEEEEPKEIAEETGAVVAERSKDGPDTNGFHSANI